MDPNVQTLGRESLRKRVAKNLPRSGAFCVEPGVRDRPTFSGRFLGPKTLEIRMVDRARFGVLVQKKRPSEHGTPQSGVRPDGKGGKSDFSASPLHRQ